MAHATESDVGNEKPTRLGLGTVGWVIWVGMVLMNFVPLMDEFEPLMLAGYFAFVLVGSYIWLRFLKFVLKKLNIL